MTDESEIIPVGEEEKVVFLLGGQGTQYFGMARSLLDEDAVFRSTMHELDRLAADRCGRSVLEYLYAPGRGFGDRCGDLLMTNLGLFLVEYSLARSLDDHGVRPDLLVGSSLGEFIAVAVAGHVPVTDVLDFLCELSDCVVRTMPPGGMVAVLAGLDQFREVVKPSADITIASVNSDRHFVISADVAALDRARRAMVAQDVLHQDLPVDFAFHSPAVNVMNSELRELGKRMHLQLSDSTSRIYSSRTCSLITEVSAETCRQVIRGPIRFTETVARIPAYRSHRYVDLSPSSSLAAILHSSLPGADTLPVITPFNTESQNIRRVVEKLGVRV